MCDFYLNPLKVRTVLDHILDFYIGFIDILFEYREPCIDFIGMGDDFAGQRGRSD